MGFEGVVDLILLAAPALVDLLLLYYLAPLPLAALRLLHPDYFIIAYSYQIIVEDDAGVDG